MLLRTRGRRTGRWRGAPLGYVIRDGSIYCCAGFGSSTFWLRNLEADPRVEVLLPGRAHTGVAEVVTDPVEGVAALRGLLASMPLVSRPLVGDAGALSDADMNAMREAIPPVRIRVTGIAAGPWDPGGLGWILSSVVWLSVVGLGVRWLRRMGSRPT
jgi:deazaflavin-dependent oxidoreductase (nitroreductase family)